MHAKASKRVQNAEYESTRALVPLYTMKSFSSRTKSAWHSLPHVSCTQCRGQSVCGIGVFSSGESRVSELNGVGPTAAAGSCDSWSGKADVPLLLSAAKHSAKLQ